MATGSLIPLLYGGCACFVVALVGIGAGLFFWGKREERRRDAQRRDYESGQNGDEQAS